MALILVDSNGETVCTLTSVDDGIYMADMLPGSSVVEYGFCHREVIYTSK